MKRALKEREQGKKRLAVIRLARASLQNRAIDLGRKLSEEEATEVLMSEVKRRREAILEYARVNRHDKVKELEEEISILQEYLPQQLSTEEIRELAREAISATGAMEVRDAGKVMAVLMPRVKGRAEGKLVHEIVKELLTGNEQSSR